MPIIRQATEADLAAIHHIYYLNEVQGDLNPPPPGAPLAEASHILRTGTMIVAEQEGQVIGYAGAITRGRVRYLTDLFVHPEVQSAGLGKALLQRALPQDELIHCTMSSTDPRAQSLYIRSGMQPQWPHFNLRWHGPLRAGLPNSPIEVLVGEATDPEVIVWDAQIGGRERAQDHAFWQGEQQSTLLWLRRDGVPIGYGYVRTGMRSFWYPTLCRIGPIGILSPEDASEGVLAVVRWACQRATIVRIDVPGPHPALAPLLAMGFHIIYVETFVSSAAAPFFDARCYIPSGSDLL
jgi:GNAT superfamily N-acetyltransferase